VIGRLQGTVVEATDDGACIVEVQGVGYEVYVPARVRAQLAAQSPASVTLHIHTHVREDALVLYGFSASEDREAFRALIGVSGVGPRIALAILSQLTAPELAAAVAGGDTNRLKAISGVGKKTAERLVLDLADRLPAKLSKTASPSGVTPATALPVGNVAIAAVGALTQMGFGRGEAERAVANVASNGAPFSLEELLRKALSTLA
jgi:Holliday junction DNA helicase RuvA